MQNMFFAFFWYGVILRKTDVRKAQPYQTQISKKLNNVTILHNNSSQTCNFGMVSSQIWLFTICSAVMFLASNRCWKARRRSWNRIPPCNTQIWKSDNFDEKNQKMLPSVAFFDFFHQNYHFFITIICKVSLLY